MGSIARSEYRSAHRSPAMPCRYAPSRSRDRQRHPLRGERADHAREDVPAPASRHTGVPRRIE